MKLPLRRRLFAVATATSVLALAVTACGYEVPGAATGPQVLPTAAAVAAAYVVEAPAHRTTMPVAPIPEPAAKAPAAAPVTPKVASGTPAKAAPKPAKAAAVKAAPAAPAAPAASRPASYRGVPVVYADPDGYPGAWGATDGRTIWIYPAAPARYVQSVLMHEYMHVLQNRAGWKDAASTHGERVADAGEQLLGGSYFKYTHGSPTSAELAEARQLLGG